jgi:hypothetical protein
LIGAGNFAGKFHLGTLLAKGSCHLAAAIAVPALFAFDATSQSVGVSMANTALRSATSAFTNSTVAIDAVPVIVDGLGALALRSVFLGQKAGYALADVVVKATGSTLGSAGIFLVAGRLAGRFEGPALVLYENAGLLLGDAIYAAAAVIDPTVVSSYSSTVVGATAAVVLASLFGSASQIATVGKAGMAVAGGVAVSSYITILQLVS